MAYRPVPLDYARPSLEEQLGRSREFLERMSARRSVRTFSSDPLPVELVENAIAAAATAPSGAHQQPWTFVVVSDPRVKQEIRAAAEEEERRNYEGRMSAEWIRALERLGTDWRKPHIEEAPYVIVVFEQVYGLAGEQKVKHYYSRESVGIAVGIMLASLHTAGVATLTHTPSPMGFLARLLGRPRNERAFVLVPVGYPAPGTTVPELGRKSLEDVIVRVEP